MGPELRNPLPIYSTNKFNRGCVNFANSGDITNTAPMIRL